MRSDFALSPEQRADARRALTLLHGSGLSLEAAAKHALHGKRALRHVTVDTAVNSFVQSRLDADCRASTVEWYERRLATLVDSFGDRHIDDIDRAEFSEWFKSIDVAEATRAGIARACRALWRWALEQEPTLVATNIVVGLKTAVPTNDGEAAFLRVDQVKQALAAAGPYRSAAALLFFAGIRPEEIRSQHKPPLRWKHIRTDERMIRIPADIAKTRKPRIIEHLPADTLWHWLTPSADPDQPIAPARIQQFVNRAKAALNLRPWPHDATRHTFATYALALTGDPGRVAGWLGHEGSPTLLHRHYRSMVSRSEAEAFFALRPPA